MLVSEFISDMNDVIDERLQIFNDYFAGSVCCF